MVKSKDEHLRQPVDADARFAARMLIRTARYGALALNDVENGAPIVAHVGVATDTDGMPFIPVSSLSGHFDSMVENGRAAMLIGQPGDGDPLAHGRLALNGVVRRAEGADHERLRRRYLARHPQAKIYIDFKDFSLWRLEISDASFIAGFGNAYVLERADVETQCADWEEWYAMEAGAVEHMNEDHRDATCLYATNLCGGTDGDWQITGLDPDGIDMALGDDHRRYVYDRPLKRAEELRPTLVGLVRRARKQSEVS